MVGRTAGGMRLLEGQMVNSQALEVTIYLHTYLHALLSLQCKQLTRAFRAGPL